MPPSITMFWPVTKRARSEQRNTTTSAMSLGRADPGERRLGRSCAPRGRARAARGAASVSGVAIMPGDTALTRIVGAYSSAADAVSATTAALAAAYGASPAAGRVPEIDAVDTIAPPPDSQDERRDRLEAVEHAGEVERDDALPLGELPVVDRGHACCRPRCCRAA